MFRIIVELMSMFPQQILSASRKVLMDFEVRCRQEKFVHRAYNSEGVYLNM
jgi:hypothetical protein